VLGWARVAGFVKRLRDVHPFHFVFALVYGVLGAALPSLETQSSCLPVKVTRQALHKRFTKAAAAFMEVCLAAVMRRAVAIQTGKLQTELLKPFSRVKVLDSSSWDLPDGQRKLFPGSGGDASAANCKLLLCYDYKSGLLDSVQLMPGSHPDTKYAVNVPKHVEAGELILTDLGFVKIRALSEIDEKKAYFICRFLSSVSTWAGPEDKEALDRLDLLGLLRNSCETAIEKEVVLGCPRRDQVRCRLVAFRVPEEVANRRRQRMREAAARQRRSLKKETLELCDWSIFLTNACAELVPAALIRTLYRIRWCVELIFKQMKSVLRIHRCSTENENRLLCEVRGKLIAAVIVHGLHARLNLAFLGSLHKETSFEKTWKRFQERASSLCEAFLQGARKAAKELRKVMQSIAATGLKENHPSRHSTLELLESQIGDATPTPLSYEDVEPFLVKC